MLREIQNVKQNSDELPRRWYSDEDIDLIVWISDDGSVAGFQLAYDKLKIEHALTWNHQSEFLHNKVDDGEGRPGKYKATPVLVPDGDFPAALITERFKSRAADIDDAVSSFVYEMLLGYPEQT